MKKEETKEFQVVSGLTLALENLGANVRISVGAEGKATFRMSGDEKLLKDIEVSQPSPNRIQIKGKGLGGGNDITVISGGGRQSVSMTSVRGGNIVISGGGSIVSVGRGGGTVIINGKVVSGEGNVETIEGGLPEIQVNVPKGTSLDITDVESTISSGLGGKLNARLGGQCSLSVSDVNGLKVKCNGQSGCTARNASGDANLSTNGQSSIEIRGNLNDVEAETNGQSHITIGGNCHDFDGEANGQSRISVSGRATGNVRQRESGQSRISVR